MYSSYVHTLHTYTSVTNYVVLDCVGIYVRFTHEEYRVKESDGYVVIKVIVSGHRSFPLQVSAISFVPTRFSLPAGQMNIYMTIGCSGI